MKRLSWFAQFLVWIGVKEKPDHKVPTDWRHEFERQYKRAKSIFKQTYGYKPKEEYIRVEKIRGERKINGHWCRRKPGAPGGWSSGDGGSNRVRIVVGPNGEEPSEQDKKDYLLHEIMHVLQENNGLVKSGVIHSPELAGIVPYWR